MNNLVTVSGAQQSDSAIHICVSILRLGVDYLAVGQGHETGRGRDSGLYLKDWALQTYKLTCHREVSSDTSVFWAKWSFAYSSKRVGL